MVRQLANKDYSCYFIILDEHFGEHAAFSLKMCSERKLIKQTCLMYIRKAIVALLAIFFS